MALSDAAMIIYLNVSRYRQQVLDKKVSAETADRYEAKRGALKAYKLLLPKRFTERLNKITRAARDYVATMTVSSLRNGERLVPMGLVQIVMEELGHMQREFYEALDEACENLDAAILEASEELREAWNEADYPTGAAFREAHEFEFSLAPIPDSAGLSKVIQTALGAEVERYTERLEADNQAMLKKAQDELVTRVKAAISNLEDKASKPSNETKIYPSLIDNIRDLVDLVPHMNLSGDPRIDQLGADLRKRFANLNADNIKLFPSAREEARDNSRAVLDNMKSWGF